MAIMGDHHAWTVAFGILGNIISVLVFLAPVPTFIRIYKKKSTECFQSLPYQVALFSSMLWLYYALLKGDAFLLVTINCFGCVVETVYISIFIAYATKSKRISAIRLFLAMDVAVFSLILLLCHVVVKSPKIRVSLLGWMCVAISISVFAAPLTVVARVIRTKSVEFMPFTLSFFLTVSAVMWFSYGLFMKDICIAVPNVLGFFLGLAQMLVYAIYRNAERSVAEKTKLPPEDLKAIVVMSAFGVTDVYPVDVEKAGDGEAKDCAKENQEPRGREDAESSSDDQHEDQGATTVEKHTEEGSRDGQKDENSESPV